MKSSSLPTTDLAPDLQSEVDEHWIIYRGSGEWLPEIPARDLSRSEFESFTEDQQASILACGLYDAGNLSPAKE